MSQQRRHAENFTDSLNSFQCTTSSDTLYSISSDSLDQIKACSLPSSGCAWNSEHSTVPSVPDLNKRIDLFQNDSSKDESVCNDKLKHSCVDFDKENKYAQSAIKGKTLSRQKDALASTPLKIKKRDTNHNIHCNNSYIMSASKKNVVKSTTKSWPIFNNSTRDGVSNSNCELQQEPAGVQKFEKILCSLDNQLNQIKEGSETESTLKRLSEKFANSPKNFTERLMTIIEESVMNSGDNTCNATAFNLSRLTLEFRKMCKFIEDESWPEWAPSLPSTPPSSEVSPVCNELANGEFRKEKLSESTAIDSLPSTPLSATDVLKRRFFQKISKNQFNGSVDGIANVSANVSSVESFEHLEAQCKKFFPEEKRPSDYLRRSYSMPSLLSMTQLEDICDQQMAALNISDTYNEDKIVSSTPNLYNKCTEQPLTDKFDTKCTKVQNKTDCKSTDMDYGNISYFKKKFNHRSDCGNRNADIFTDVYAKFDTDELEKTILQDIAEKRKRCLDTARLITEINADTVHIEEKRSLGISPIPSALNDSNSAANNEAKFLQTLMSCKDYLSYLERQKPFFNLYEKSESHAPSTPLQNKGDANVKSVETGDSLKRISTVKPPIPKKSPSNLNDFVDHDNSPISRNGSKEYREKTERVKSKLFVTPGKSPPAAKYKRKKEYFPNICSNSPKDNLEAHILKSPHAKGLYRLNYNTIVSPVGMYIRGTDMQLIKNVRARTDDLLLTPVKKTAKSPLGRNSKQSKPLNGTTKCQEKLPLKLNLSPKVGVNHIRKQEVIASTEASSIPKNNLILPKVSYKLPLQVKTIKDTNSPRMGNRVKKLLESAQSKVVIRHEGRIKSQRKQQDTGVTPTDEVLEIHYEPEDISIHVEQAASKTNFIHKQKY